ncbi:MAG TPA: anaerobic ribonucleoside-triphosphate reductase activating protein [Sphingobacterium sp.]|nr:anaerobic ribonucleoside-triphosphate reductase activating protein [Sphingobacterium sp.]
MAKPIYSITPFTLLDYPNHPACILWFAGCNMRCVYCYNPEIVLGKGKLGITEVTKFLQSRQGLLQAVVFSGGECTIHSAFVPLVQTAKDLGYLVKVDTNGTRPKLLKQLIVEGLIDYVALDFKGLGRQHVSITQSDTFPSFPQSLAVLLEATIPFEIRTTWHSALLTLNDIRSMINYLEQYDYQGNYYIQRFFNDVSTLGELPDMYDTLDTKSLSTANIKVSLRNG